MIDASFWRGRRVLLTGHTGFKGAWTALLLRAMGAEVYGLSLPPDSTDGVFNVAGVQGDVTHRIGDIRDLSVLRSAMDAAKPEVVIHMAAQSLVRLSYDQPVETFATNVMGTVNLLEAARASQSIKAIVIVTSDKCYENAGLSRGYREDDPMGGHDPYSSSKGCAEIVTSAYRRSFFHKQPSAQVASARAGNVIGGGDWAADRLVPDIMRGFMTGETVRIRNPGSVRPWQHVLDPVMGYLVLAQKLVLNGEPLAQGWNFGPGDDSEVAVSRIVKGLADHWGSDARWAIDAQKGPHEAAYLKLDCQKARDELKWQPRIALDNALKLSSDWYKAFHHGEDMRAVTLRQIETILAS